MINDYHSNDSNLLDNTYDSNQTPIANDYYWQWIDGKWWSMMVHDGEGDLLANWWMLYWWLIDD